MPSTAPDMPVVHVAVGVVLDKANQILISRRAPDSHQGGLWEFPGGKVEAGENVRQALARELREELGIVLICSTPLLEVQHDYGDKRVLLDVYVVTEFSGNANGLEDQPLAWVRRDCLDQYAFPAANVPIIKAIKDWLVKQKA